MLASFRHKYKVEIDIILKYFVGIVDTQTRRPASFDKLR